MKGTDAIACWFFLFSTITICAAIDKIGANESIRYGKTLVSLSEIFELGFFLEGSNNWYIGIWYNKPGIKKVVWVANRDKPLNDTNGVLKVTEGGLLVLLDVEERIVWSTNSSRSPTNSVAQLLDTGNLVVKDGSDGRSDNYLWQSFDYPCNVLLPGMKLGFNLVNGHEWSLSSWKTDDDPAQGKYSRRIDRNGYPQSITFNGQDVKSRLGPWNGIGYSGYTVVNPNEFIVSEFLISEEEIYFKFELVSSTLLSILELQPDGFVQRFVWTSRTSSWNSYRNAQTDSCDSYGVCGAYGSCTTSSIDRCTCLSGFKPRWSSNGADWAAGCARNTPLECGEKDVFIRHPSVKLPDTRISWYNKSTSLGECKTMCLKNCSCTAYSNLDVRNGGTGCLLWFGDLIDTKESSTNPQDLYLRVASSEVGIEKCDICTSCGAHGKCNISNTHSCECLEGFTPKNGEEWRMGNWSNGCVWATQQACGENSNFILQQNIKLPDTSMSSYYEKKTLEECKTQCSNSCNCTAYAKTELTNGGTGCFLWSGELLDIGHCQMNGQDLYVKVPGENGTAPGGNRHKLMIKLVSAFVAVFSVLLVGVSIFIWRKRNQPSRDRIADLKFYDFATIATATNNFSDENKLGEGGFGPVYKGVLEDGLEIAVKKLARKSEQGETEFKNEVIYIAKLQHRNLVKLLGYSLQGSEKILVYEFLPHKSLDLFIFDPIQSKALDWSKRLEIIKKTARGILYLHEDSRLNIIHRDLKASNILLDHDMNPKISDFGTAKSFREEGSEGTTKIVVGTYGYISPEYAMDGIFSAKSDVYSYGVLVLEIVSGCKNGRLHQPGQRLNLSGHAWNLFQDGRQMELIDASIRPPSDMNELLRAIHVGLLCVQHFPEDRPKMASVVLMLEGDRILPPPKEPGFYGDKNMLEAFLGETSSVRNGEGSVNMLSITHMEGR